MAIRYCDNYQRKGESSRQVFPHIFNIEILLLIQINAAFLDTDTTDTIRGGIHKISCVPEQIPMGGNKVNMFAKRLELFL